MSTLTTTLGLVKIFGCYHSSLLYSSPAQQVTSILSSWLLQWGVFAVDAEEKDDLAEESAEDAIVRSKVSYSKDAWLRPACLEVLLKLSLFSDIPDSSIRKLFLSCLSLFFACEDSFIETLLCILRLEVDDGRGGRLARSGLFSFMLNILNSSFFIFVFLRAKTKGEISE